MNNNEVKNINSKNLNSVNSNLNLQSFVDALNENTDIQRKSLDEKSKNINLKNSINLNYDKLIDGIKSSTKTNLGLKEENKTNISKKILDKINVLPDIFNKTNMFLKNSNEKFSNFLNDSKYTMKKFGGSIIELQKNTIRWFGESIERSFDNFKGTLSDIMSPELQALGNVMSVFSTITKPFGKIFSSIKSIFSFGRKKNNPDEDKSESDKRVRKKTENVLDRASRPGSIFTHDIHLEKILEDSADHLFAIRQSFSTTFGFFEKFFMPLKIFWNKMFSREKTDGEKQLNRLDSLKRILSDFFNLNLQKYKTEDKNRTLLTSTLIFPFKVMGSMISVLKGKKNTLIEKMTLSQLDILKDIREYLMNFLQINEDERRERLRNKAQNSMSFSTKALGYLGWGLLIGWFIKKFWAQISSLISDYIMKPMLAYRKFLDIFDISKFTNLIRTITSKFTIFESIGEMFGKISNFIKPIIDKLKIGFKAFGTFLSGTSVTFNIIGKLGKIFLKFVKFLRVTPIIGQLIMIFDFFVGFFKSEGSIIDKIKSGLSNVLTSLIDSFIGIPMIIIEWITNKLFKSIFNIDLPQGWGNNITNMISEWASKLVDWFMKPFYDLYEMFSGQNELFNSKSFFGKIRLISKGLTKIFDFTWQKLKSLMSDLWNWIISPFKILSDWWANFSFDEMISGITEYFTGIFKSAKDWILSPFKGLYSFFFGDEEKKESSGSSQNSEPVLDNLLNFFTNFGDIVTDFITNNPVMKKVSGMWDSLTGSVSDFFSFGDNKEKEKKPTITEQLPKNTTKETFESLDRMKKEEKENLTKKDEFFQSTIKDLKDGINNLGSSISENMNSILNIAGEKAGNALSSITNIISNATSSSNSSVEIPDSVESLGIWMKNSTYGF